MSEKKVLKLKKDKSQNEAPSVGQGMPEPMGGASDVPTDDENPEPTPSPEDGGIDAPMDSPDGQMPPAEDNDMANMDDEEEMPADDSMGEEPTPEGEDDSTMSIINQLSSEDKEAVRSYAESLLKRSEPSQEEQPMGDEQPMMESMILKKGEMESLLENFGPSQDELFMDSDKNKSLTKKAKKTVSSDSPFSAPKFEEK